MIDPVVRGLILVEVVPGAIMGADGSSIGNVHEPPVQSSQSRLMPTTRRTGPWTKSQVWDFIAEARIPIRLLLVVVGRVGQRWRIRTSPALPANGPELPPNLPLSTGHLGTPRTHRPLKSVEVTMVGWVPGAFKASTTSFISSPLWSTMPSPSKSVQVPVFRRTGGMIAS